MNLDPIAAGTQALRTALDALPPWPGPAYTTLPPVPTSVLRTIENALWQLGGPDGTHPWEGAPHLPRLLIETSLRLRGMSQPEDRGAPSVARLRDVATQMAQVAQSHPDWDADVFRFWQALDVLPIRRRAIMALGLLEVATPPRTVAAAAPLWPLTTDNIPSLVRAHTHRLLALGLAQWPAEDVLQSIALVRAWWPGFSCDDQVEILTAWATHRTVLTLDPWAAGEAVRQAGYAERLAVAVLRAGTGDPELRRRLVANYAPGPRNVGRRMPVMEAAIAADVRALPIEVWTRLAQHEDPEVRLAAIQLLPILEDTARNPVPEPPPRQR